LFLSKRKLAASYRYYWRRDFTFGGTSGIFVSVQKDKFGVSRLWAIAMFIIVIYHPRELFLLGAKNAIRSGLKPMMANACSLAAIQILLSHLTRGEN